MKLNQFGGGLFEFHWNVGGVCCFESSVAKMGGGSTFFIKYGLIIEHICNFFAFLGWFPKIFYSKFSPAYSIWGGVYTEYLHFGGGTDQIRRKWGGSASGARRAQNWYTPPLLMFLIPSLNLKNVTGWVSGGCLKGISKVSRRCLEGVWKCLVGVLKLSVRFKEGLLDPNQPTGWTQNFWNTIFET